MPATSARPRGARRLARTLLLVAAAGGIAVATSAIAAPTFSATARVTSPTQYLGDSVGTTFTVAVKNTGSTRIAAVEVARPSLDWTVSACPTGPLGWTRTLSANACRYVSGLTTADDIAAGATKTFTLKAKTAQGRVNRVGNWKVKVSKTRAFAPSGNLVSATPSQTYALRTVVYTWQIVSAPIASGARSGTCPPLVKTAHAGSSKTIVVCARNHAYTRLRPAVGSSPLGGSLINTRGTFSSSTAPARSSSLAVASWADTVISRRPATGKTVIVRLGSSSDATSPWTTLTGYAATNLVPVAADDAIPATEDAVATGSVLGNDSDGDGDPFTAVLGSTTTHGSLALTSAGGYTYTPDADFNGTDTFTYRVKDAFSTSPPATATITVASVNDVPVAGDTAATVDEDGSTPVSLTATDVDQQPLTFSITSAPAHGSLVAAGLPVCLGGTCTAPYTYTPDGNYNGADAFTFRANDGAADSNAATGTLTVTSINDVPVANANSYTTPEDTALVIAAPGTLGNDTDADGDALTAALVSGTSNGSLTSNADGSFTYVPNADFNGVDSFTYKANDGTADSVNGLVTITVSAVNDAPTTTSFSASTPEDTAKPLNLTWNDVDGDSLTWSVVAGPTHGTLGPLVSNTVTYTPAANYFGPDSFTFKANDGTTDSNTSTVTLTVTSVNDAPVANADAYSTDEDTATVVAAPGVLTNDTDVEGDPLTAVLVGGVSHGALTLNSDGSFTYTPNADYNGPDSFSYKANDGQADSTSAVTAVTINAVNDAPIATADVATVPESSTGQIINVLGNDSDVDAGQFLTVTGIDTTGTTGTVTNNGTDVTYDPNGMFETLGNGQTASDTFTYTVSDGAGGTDTETVTITIQGANDAPNAVDDNASATEAVGVLVNVVANDTDAEGPFTVTSVNTTGTGGTVTNNNDGTLSYDPNGAFEDLGNGEDRDDTFTYTITDGQGGTDTATVTIDVNGINDAPIAAADPANVSENSTGTVVNVLGNDTDADSQTLTVTGIDTTGTTGQVTNNGTDVTYDPNGMFEYLGNGQTASDMFTYTVTDSQGGTDTETVTITIQGANDAPNAVNDNASATEAVGVLVNVVANDTDAEGSVTVTSVNTTGTSGTVTNNNDGTLSYDPNGAFEDLGNGEDRDDTFTYTITDGQSGTDTATVTIDVNGINDAPIAAADPASVGENSTGTVVNVLGNDTDAESQTLTVTGVDTTGTTGTVTNNGTDVTYDPNHMFEYLDTGETAQDTFTYTVTDSQGGTDTETVTITVQGSNDAPVAVDDAYQAAQSTTLVVALPGVLSNDTDADNETMTAGNASDPAHGSVTLGPDGSFSYTPDTGYLGSDSFTYDVSDGTATDTATVSLTVSPPNATPTADATSASGNEDVVSIPVTLTGHDADGNGLTFSTGTPANGLVSVPSGTSCNANTPSLCTATVNYSPNANFFGSDSFTYTVYDGTISSAPATASITVNAVNDQPSFAKGANQTVNEDSGPQTVVGWATAVSAGPANESAQTVTFAASTNNDALFAVLPAVGSNGDLTYTPAVNANGAATVTVQATDDGGTANGANNQSPTQQFTITVTAVNDVPSFTKGANQTLLEDPGAQSVSGWATAISKGPADESAQTLAFTVTNDNNALFSGQPAVSPTGTLTYTPAPNAVGSATVSVSLADSGGIANGGDNTSDVQTFTVTVNAVNDEPSFTHDGNQTVLEDAGAQSVAGFVNTTSAGPADESAQTVTVAVVGLTNPTLFLVAPDVTSGTLTYRANTNANGSSTVTVRATDDGGTANGGDATGPDMTFTITVTAVNDEPSFTKGADQSLNEDPGAQSVSGWATSSTGPTNESAQTVAFTVSNDLNALFSGQPAVSPTGTLTFTPAPNKWGTATVSVYVSDNGGTANGGDDTSPTQTFTITVNAVNDAPVAAAKAFTAQANMKLSLGGLRTGATDPNDVNGDATGNTTFTPSFTVGSITVGAGCTGCTVSNVNTANGTFDFDPPAGGTGSYTLTYTVVDSGYPAPGATSAPATMTFTVNGPVIWFVDTAAGGGGTGRLSAPFNTLAGATTAMGSNTNQRIFVDNGNVTGNVTLPTDGWLISDAVTGADFDTVMGITPPAGTIARPAIASGTQRNLTGTVTLGTNSTVRGFNLTPGSGGQGLVGSGKTGVTVDQMNITTTSARAVNLSGGTSGTFALTSVNATGADRGISLDTVNVSTGSFTVAGTGTSGSGGTITTSTALGTNTVGAGEGGIYLKNTKNVSLDRVIVTANLASGIYGNDVTTFTLANSTVSGNGTEEVRDHDGIRFENLLGTSSISATTVSGSREDNVGIINTSGTATITVSNSTMSTNDSNVGANGLYVDSSGTSAVTFTSTSNTLTSNNTDGMAIFSQGTQKMNVTVTGGTYTNNGVGLDIETNGSGGMQFSVTGGTVNGCTACGVPVNLYKGSGATGTGTNATAGTFTGMTITNGNSLSAPGIWVHGEGPGAARIAVTNNNVSQVAHNGILASFGNTLGGTQNADVTITGNTVTTNASGVLHGISVDAGTLAADSTSVCADVGGAGALANTVSATDPDSTANAAVFDIRVRNRQAGTSFRLPGYAGAAGDTTAVQNFIDARNNTTDVFASHNAGNTGFAGGALCAAP